MDYNEKLQRVRIVHDFLEEEVMNWLSRSPDLIPDEHVLDVLGRATAHVTPLH